MTEQDFMKSQGYSEETPDPIYRRDGVTYWYRKVPGTDRHQFIVRKWPPFAASVPTYEVEMVYETNNEIWAETKFYGLTYTQLCANLSGLEKSLFDAVSAMGGNQDHYHFDGEN